MNDHSVDATRSLDGSFKAIESQDQFDKIEIGDIVDCNISYLRRSEPTNYLTSCKVAYKLKDSIVVEFVNGWKYKENIQAMQTPGLESALDPDVNYWWVWKHQINAF